LLQNKIQFHELVYYKLIYNLQYLSPFIALNLLQNPVTALLKFIQSVPLHIHKTFTYSSLNYIAIPTVSSNIGFITTTVNGILYLPLTAVI